MPKRNTLISGLLAKAIVQYMCLWNVRQYGKKKLNLNLSQNSLFHE